METRLSLLFFFFQPSACGGESRLHSVYVPTARTPVRGWMGERVLLLTRLHPSAWCFFPFRQIVRRLWDLKKYPSVARFKLHDDACRHQESCSMCFTTQCGSSSFEREMLPVAFHLKSSARHIPFHLMKPSFEYYFHNYSHD